MKHALSILCVSLAVCGASAPAAAQKLGVGGTGVDDASSVPACAQPLGTIALVEEKAKSDSRMDALPPQIRAMMKMAQAQQGGGGSVDPLPLLKLLVARSRCFTVVDCGAGFEAIQRERAMATGNIAAGSSATAASSSTLQAADYMLVAQVVYSDAKSRQSGGLFGDMGFQQKTLEAQTLLSLTSVASGIQEAVASGQARKKDIGVLFGGLSNLGVGALGGTYASSDMRKITALALLDEFRKLIADASTRNQRNARANTSGKAQLPHSATALAQVPPR